MPCFVYILTNEYGNFTKQDNTDHNTLSALIDYRLKLLVPKGISARKAQPRNHQDTRLKNCHSLHQPTLQYTKKQQNYCVVRQYVNEHNKPRSNDLML